MEAVALRSKLIEGILDGVIELDKLISLTNKRGTTALIWSNISRHDAEVLTDAILIVARREARVGLAVRGIVKAWTLYHAGVIAGPRLVETILFYVANGGPSLWPLMLKLQTSMQGFQQTVDSQPM